MFSRRFSMSVAAMLGFGSLGYGGLAAPANFTGNELVYGKAPKGHSWRRSKKRKRYMQNHQRKRCHGRWK